MRDCWKKTVSIIGAGAVVCGGILTFGNVVRSSIVSYKRSCQLIEVKGLSEKLIKSDKGIVTITASCSDEDSQKLLEKRVKAKHEINQFLSRHGISKEELVDEDFNTYRDTERRGYSESATDVQIFRTRDEFTIASKDVDKVKALYGAQDELLELTKHEICINVLQRYIVSDFSSVKTELLQEATQNARNSAATILSASRGANHSINLEEDYVKQGEISITAPNSTEASYGSSESSSIMKKFRLVVRAGYRLTSK